MVFLVALSLSSPWELINLSEITEVAIQENTVVLKHRAPYRIRRKATKRGLNVEKGLRCSNHTTIWKSLLKSRLALELPKHNEQQHLWPRAPNSPSSASTFGTEHLSFPWIMQPCAKQTSKPFQDASSRCHATCPLPDHPRGRFQTCSTCLWATETLCKCKTLGIAWWKT